MSQQMVSKVVLSSKKEVLLREMKIKDTRLAAQAASPKAKGDQNVLSMLVQEELLKLLLVQIDGKTPSAAEREDLDNLFTMAEYRQLMVVIAKIAGVDEDMGKELAIENVSFGSK